MNAQEEKLDKKLDTRVPTVTEHTNEIMSWEEIPWKQIEKYVWRLQQRIFRAESNGQHRKVKQLQRLLMRSKATLFLSIRQVTQLNKGKRTAGVDGFKTKTSKQRFELYKEMEDKYIFNHNPRPTRRVQIPKKNGKLRPLSIPTIKDRVYQNIAKKALEPQWEAKFESVSYGFRPKRGCHDAVVAIYTKLVKGKKRWIFEGDFKGCFDNLNHDFIMEQIKGYPANKVVEKWLKAGYIDKNTFNKTEAGTPQGGIISPLLANIALHGMEDALNIKYRCKTSKRDGTVWEMDPRSNYTMIRYADDFVVMCETKEQAEKVYELLEPYLKTRGLELAAEKTKVTNITEGFDFLGFNIRRYEYTKKNGNFHSKLLIKPSKESIKKCKKDIKEIFKKCNGTNVNVLLTKLNPVITGKANYWSPAVAKEIFADIDRYVWLKIRKFLKRLHPKKSWKWRYKKYFKPDKYGISKDKWLLTDPVKRLQIVKMAWTPIIRHSMVVYKNTPYDKSKEEYFFKRDIKEFERNSVKLRQKLAKNQKFTCPLCGNPIVGCEEGIERHHWTPKAKGGKDTLKNQSLIHTSCHIEWHKIYPAKGEIPTIENRKTFRLAYEKNRRIAYQNEMKKVEQELLNNSEIFNAYIDGSYNEEKDIYGSGIFTLYNGNMNKYIRPGKCVESKKYRNVAGELEASIWAIKQAIKEKAKTVVIYHDYEGVAKYAEGSWKAKKEYTKAYKAKFEQLNKKVAVKFVWIKSHKGHKYNELADMLAKKAVGLL